MNSKKILAAMLTASVLFSGGCGGKIKTGKVMQEETPYAYVISQLGDDVMPGIAATLKSRDDIGLGGQDIDNLPFSFIAPLGPN